MRRVLIVLIVVCLASSANAGFILGARDNPLCLISDVVQVIGEFPVPASANLYVVSYGDIEFTGASLSYSGSLSSVMLLEDYATFLGYPDGASLLTDFAAYGLSVDDLIAITLADGAIPQASLAGLMVDGITMTGTQGRIALYDADTFNQLGSSVIPCPEPTTIALLSLGGLFLRRRK